MVENDHAVSNSQSRFSATVSVNETERWKTFMVSMGKSLIQACTATNEAFQGLLKSPGTWRALRHEVTESLNRADRQCFGKNISQVRALNRELEAANSALISQVQSSQPLIESLTQTNSDHRQRIDYLTSQLADITTQLDTTQTNLTMAQAALTDKDTRIAQLTESSDSLSTQLRLLEETYSNAVSTFAAEVNTSADRISKLETELLHATADLNTSVSKQRATERSYSQAKVDIIYLKEDLEVERALVSESRQKSVNAESTVKNCMQRMTCAEDLAKTAGDEINRLRQENSRFRDDERSWDAFLMQKMPEWEEAKKRAAAAEALCMQYKNST